MEKKGKLEKQNCCKTCKQQKRLFKMTSKPSYMPHKIFDDDLVAKRKSKVKLKLNNPAQFRLYILELSEILMYELHYDYIKKKYDHKSKLLFTDTVGLLYEIYSEDVYEDSSSDK